MRLPARTPHPGLGARHQKSNFRQFTACAALQVADYGICSVCPPGHFLSQQIGTPYYVAPEVGQVQVGLKVRVIELRVLGLVQDCSSYGVKNVKVKLGGRIIEHRNRPVGQHPLLIDHLDPCFVKSKLS